MSCCRADWTAYICRGDKLNSMYRCWAVQGRGLVKGYQGGYPPISRCTGMPAGTWGQGTSDQSKQSSSSTPCRLIWTEQFVGWITCRMDLTYTVAWFRKELLREDILCRQTRYPRRPISQSEIPCKSKHLPGLQGGSSEFPIVGYWYFWSLPVACFFQTTPRLVSCQSPQFLQVNLLHPQHFFWLKTPDPFPFSNLYLTDIIVVDDDPQSNFHLHLLLGLCRV